MMANAPVAQKSGFASVIGTGKPAAAMEGMGMDFLALLEQAEAMPTDGAPASGGQGVAVVPGLQMPEGDSQSCGAESMSADASSLAQPAPEPARSLSAETHSVNHPIAVQKAPAKPAAARLAQTVSSLPQLAMAMNPATDAQPLEKPTRDVSGKGEEILEHEDKKPAMADGLALPLLQNIERLATVPGTSGEHGQATPVPDDPQAAALKAFALPPAALRQAGALPDRAAEPAERQAGERLEAFILPMGHGLPETAQVPEKAAAANPVRQKVEESHANMQMTAVAATIMEAGQNAPAPVQRRTAATQPVETSAAPAAPAVPTAAPVVPVAQFVMTDVAAPMMAAPVADTAAMLGEQVIDMGVDGQWIDRMAREIADISAGTGRASFTLNPDNLGRLQVEILQRDEGADVRLIAETDDAVNALNQGRHQLQQDSRLQAARINDVQIERSNVNSDNVPATRSAASGQELAQQQGQSQSQPFHKKPLIESVSSRTRGEEPGEGAESAASSRNARYA